MKYLQKSCPDNCNENGARIDFSLNLDGLFDSLVEKYKDKPVGEVARNGQHGAELDVKIGADGTTRYGVGGIFKGKYITYRGLGNYLIGYLTGQGSNRLSQADFMKVAGEYNATNSIWKAGLVSIGATPTVNEGPYYGESLFSGYFLVLGFNDGLPLRKPLPPPSRINPILMP